MAFFDSLGKKVSDAAQSAARKSSELVEVTKLNMSINAEEDKIKKHFSKIGEETYNKHSGGKEIDPDFLEMCQEIDLFNDTIENLKLKILDLKNLKLCPNCGTELDKSVQFCLKCGTKQEDAAEEAAVPEGKVCSNCGASISEGSAFCQSCGQKVE